MAGYSVVFSAPAFRSVNRNQHGRFVLCRNGDQRSARGIRDASVRQASPRELADDHSGSQEVSQELRSVWSARRPWRSRWTYCPVPTRLTIRRDFGFVPSTTAEVRNMPMLPACLHLPDVKGKKKHRNGRRLSRATNRQLSIPKCRGPKQRAPRHTALATTYSEVQIQLTARAATQAMISATPTHPTPSDNRPGFALPTTTGSLASNCSATTCSGSSTAFTTWLA
jgi:hypothetical protein